MTAAQFEALGAVATPVVVAAIGIYISVKLSRSTELLKVRLDYYREILPDLNKLMTYMTFIGTWRDIPPTEIIALKRRLDTTVHCAAPLFSREVIACYDALMNLSFVTFNSWGQDAKILSNAFRRRQSWRGRWDPAWDDCFELRDGTTISGKTLSEYRTTYDKLVARIVRDLNINRARERYTTAQVSLNAHRPQPQDVPGSQSTS